MLIQFSVENFLSFKNEAILNMQASNDKSNPQNIINSAQGTDFNLLKCVLIYGANASGKTNLFKAMFLVRKLVATSAKNQSDDGSLGIVPFKLDESCLTKPSTFDVTFIEDGTRYQYGFSATEKRIVQEWLYSYPHNRRRILFERSCYDKDKPFYFGEHWKGEAQRLATMTRDNALFISVATQFNHKLARKITNWFRIKFRFIRSDPIGSSEEVYTARTCFEYDEAKNDVLRLLKNADFAIDDISIERKNIRELDRIKSLPPKLIDIVAEKMDVQLDKEKGFNLKFEHTGVSKNGKTIPVLFNIAEESNGTQKYFAIAGPLLNALENGSCLMADELDVRLHPLLTNSIIEMFQSDKVNEKAQLVCAIHDIHIMSQKDKIRRDQIWFADREKNGSTRLYSAWDYKARKYEKIHKNYLAGSYDAIPYIEELI